MKLKLALLAILAAPGLALADLPAGVSASITSAYTDVGSALGLMIVGGAAIWGTRKVLHLFGR